MLAVGQLIDGYRLIRLIGEGGFGSVWLCILEATDEYKALKFLPEANAKMLERELEAVIRYRAATSTLHCPNLVPIEHINRTERGLFYTMPLADGLARTLPHDLEWRPKTLASLIELRKSDPFWFSSDEIKWIILQLLEGVKALSSVGILHRDIKPENILFIGDRPSLADVSLLADDSLAVTRRGTPGYAAPSWYIESGGNPDFWGTATTFYSLLTGNPPDKMGRSAFLWPPHGKKSLSTHEQEEWHRLHRIIWRTTQESPLERFLRFEDMATLLAQGEVKASLPSSPVRKQGRRIPLLGWVIIGCLGLFLIGWLIWERSIKVYLEDLAANQKVIYLTRPMRLPEHRSEIDLPRRPRSDEERDRSSSRSPQYQPIPGFVPQPNSTPLQFNSRNRESGSKERPTSRLYNLEQLAKEALGNGEFDIATEHAKQILLLIEGKVSKHGGPMHLAHIILGHCALFEGNVALAKESLLKAGQTTGTPVLKSFGPDMSLAEALLKKGEVQTVLTYLEACSVFWSSHIDKLTDWSIRINKGQIPDFGANLRYHVKLPKTPKEQEKAGKRR